MSAPSAPDARPGRRGRAAKLALACGSLLVGALAVELVARATLERPIAHHAPTPPAVTRPSDDPRLVYELAPFARDLRDYPAVDGWPARTIEYEINADGFRDELFVKPKPSGTFRVAIVGDSFTFGIGVAAADTFPKVMQRRLRELVRDASVEVMNCGVYGYNTRQEVALIESRVLAFEPDWVIVCFYMNDVTPVDFSRLRTARETELARKLGLTFDAPRATAPTADHVQWKLRRASVVLDHLAARLERKLRIGAYQRTLRDNWGVEGSPGWTELATYLAMLPALLAERSIEPRMIVFPDLTLLGDDYPWREQHRSLAELCRANGIEFHDLLPILIDQDPRELQVHVSDSHPNERCHLLVGERLAQGFAPAIRERVAR